MSSSPQAHADARSLLQAARAQKGLVLLLWLLAAGSWWWSAARMSGMDSGPWTALGTAAWFLPVWVVMMAAMMLPSVAPTVALYARMTHARSPVLPLTFVIGYLAAWAASGVLVYWGAQLVLARWGEALAWQHNGRLLAGVVLIMAAAYQFTPAKTVCLRHCRSPLGQLLGRWRDGLAGALQMGAVNGTWCVGCCWALMLALCALGIMSVTWMAVVAAIIALEKLLPWQPLAVYSAAVVLLALGIAMLLAPEMIPGLVIPPMEGMAMP